MSLGSFGNPITGADGDLTVNQVQSPNFNLAAKTGWQIQKNGNAFFFNITATGTITATEFDGTDFTIKAAGYFLYSGTPAAGDLFASIAAVAGTDGFGNPYQKGITVYGTGGGWIELANGTGPNGANISQLLLSTADTSQTQTASLISYVSGTGATRFLATKLLAATFGTDLGTPQVFLTSATADGTTADERVFIEAGAGGTVLEVDGGFGTPRVLITGQLNFTTPGSGPFLASEGFHTVSLAAGLTGLLSGAAGIRVKQLPWNGIWIDIQVSAAATGTFTCGSLPSAAYYPNVSRTIPLGVNGANNNARLFIPTSGAVQIIVGGSGAWAGGTSAMYPTN